MKIRSSLDDIAASLRDPVKSAKPTPAPDTPGNHQQYDSPGNNRPGIIMGDSSNPHARPHVDTRDLADVPREFDPSSHYRTTANTHSQPVHRQTDRPEPGAFKPRDRNDSIYPDPPEDYPGDDERPSRKYKYQDHADTVTPEEATIESDERVKELFQEVNNELERERSNASYHDMQDREERIDELKETCMNAFGEFIDNTSDEDHDPDNAFAEDDRRNQEWLEKDPFIAKCLKFSG